MKKVCSILFFLIMIFGSRAYAQEPAPAETVYEPAAVEETPSEEAYEFPYIAPAATLFGGYGIVSLNGSPTADEYDYLHDSVTLGGELKIFSFPHRLHLDIDFRNKKDYFGDLSYAYRDLVLFRAINRTLWQNLENINLAADFTPNGNYSVNPEDEGVEYGIRWGMTTASLRFKTPNYPLHVYLDGGIIVGDGTMQQRFLGGAGYFHTSSGNVPIVRTSESRDVDWETKQLTITTNAHLGPLEVEYSHGEKRFDPGSNYVLYDQYDTATDSGGTTLRNGGIFPHNLIPDLKGSSNTIKIHTSYTGRLVASATFTKIDRENNDSGAKADYFIGAGDVTWTAAANLAVFLKYRHKEADIDNPLTVTIDNVCSSLNYPEGCFVKPSISSISDIASATVRYRPFSGLTLRGEYIYDHIRRENFEEWGLPEKTQHNTVSLSADTRIMRNLNLRAGYTYKEVNDPAYNIEPDYSNEGHATVSWNPFRRIITLVSYGIAKEKRDDLNTVNGPEAKNRDVKRDRAMAAVTYLAGEKVSLTASYTYIHDKIRQDIVLGGLLEPFVPDTDLARSYGLTVNYIPNNRINLTAGLSYTLSSGSFSLTDPALLSPVSLATLLPSLSALKMKETDCSLSARYNFKNGFSAGVQYRYLDFNDELDNPWDDVQDGRVHIVLLTLSKKW
jgi:predicted porin